MLNLKIYSYISLLRKKKIGYKCKKNITKKHLLERKIWTKFCGTNGKKGQKMRVDVYSQINKMLGQIQNLLSSPSLPPLYPLILFKPSGLASAHVDVWTVAHLYTVHIYRQLSCRGHCSPEVVFSDKHLSPFWGDFLRWLLNRCNILRPPLDLALHTVKKFWRISLWLTTLLLSSMWSKI